VVVLFGVGVAAQLGLLHGQQPVFPCDSATSDAVRSVLFDGRRHPERSSSTHLWERRDVALVAAAVRCGELQGRSLADVDRAFGGSSDDGATRDGRGRLRGYGLFVPSGRVLGVASLGARQATVEVRLARDRDRVVGSWFFCPAGSLVRVPACAGIESVRGPGPPAEEVHGEATENRWILAPVRRSRFMERPAVPASDDSLR